MQRRLPVGQRVRLKDDVPKCGGLSGEVIHLEWVTEEAAYRREHPYARRTPGRPALVVQLDNPPPNLEPVIMCYEEQVSTM